MKNEIILYRPNELAEHIEVRLENDTVWLSQEQISFLFQRDQSVISRHIRNVFRENELDEISNMQKLHIANSDKLVTFYNLDVIISVGYRVKSKQGTQFRIWATSVLRDYLLKGYAINQRVDRIENNLENLTKEIGKISLQLKTNELPTQGVFFNGQIFDAYELMSRIIRSATKEIILIDNYIDETVLTHLGKRTENVAAIIYTKSISKTLKLDLEKHNNQYPPIQLQELRDSHDRFLIIDRKELYHIGASLKDLGKKWFAFSKLDNKMLDFVLGRLIENQA
jgi:hypothetical protein